MRLRALAGLLLLSTAGLAPTASAAPPEGCIGFPSVPEAFVCIREWRPENAASAVGQSSQTVTVPAFCVFECFGPTPVEVPWVELRPASGVVAYIDYRGETYTVGVPPSGTADEMIARVQQEVTAAVATVLATAEQEATAAVATVLATAEPTMETVAAIAAKPQLAFDGTMWVDCFGCGGTENGTMTATAYGSAGGPYQGSITSEFSVYAPEGASCLVSSRADGSMTIHGVTVAAFTWTQLGQFAVLSHTSDRGAGAGFAHAIVTQPMGNPCGSSVSIMVTGALTTS